MRFMPTDYRRSIVWLACALVAAAAPAEAWDQGKCMDTKNAAAFRDLLAPMIINPLSRQSLNALGFQPDVTDPIPVWKEIDEKIRGLPGLCSSRGEAGLRPLLASRKKLRRYPASARARP
jgi:hypothetical protein